MLVSMSVDIDAPADAVWPFLVEPDKTMGWFTALKRFEWLSDERGVGADFYWFEEASGREYSIWFTTTEWKPPHVFGYRMTRGDFFKSYDERWEIEAVPGGSRFTFNDHIEFKFGPIGKVIGFFAARGARKTGAEVLANLKRSVEESVR